MLAAQMIKPTSGAVTPAACFSRNLTYYVASHDQRANVKLTADGSIDLPVGSFTYRTTTGCTLTVNVISKGK